MWINDFLFLLLVLYGFFSSSSYKSPWHGCWPISAVAWAGSWHGNPTQQAKVSAGGQDVVGEKNINTTAYENNNKSLNLNRVKKHMAALAVRSRWDACRSSWQTLEVEPEEIDDERDHNELLCVTGLSIYVFQLKTATSSQQTCQYCN